ncbi:MAG: hydroxypyruvate isomerase family protein [Thalassobaculales bacterium]
MPRFAANIGFLFTEYPFLDRFAAAAAAGFRAVEYMSPYDYRPEVMAGLLRQHGLRQVLINSPAGDWAAGERGTAALAGRTAEFRDGIDRAIAHAKATATPALHVMAGIAGPEARALYVENVAWAAERLERAGIDCLIEPINRRDIPGYFLADFGLALAVIEEIDAPNLKLQYDVYHRQILHGDVIRSLEALLPRIGHVQIAGVPDRGEPDAGELNYAHVFAALDSLGYAGWVGCEYRPRGRTADGLGWMAKLA